MDAYWSPLIPLAELLADAGRRHCERVRAAGTPRPLPRAWFELEKDLEAARVEASRQRAEQQWLTANVARIYENWGADARPRPTSREMYPLEAGAHNGYALEAAAS